MKRFVCLWMACMIMITSVIPFGIAETVVSDSRTILISESEASLLSNSTTEPTAEPTVEPTVEPTEPSTEPTEPSTEPTEPGTEPTEPSTEGTEPTTKPTEPTTKPGAGGEEIPKTDNDNMVLNYFAVMMVAAFAVLFTVLLGKKKYMA